MGVRYLEAYGDSKLIINQVKSEYKVHYEDLIPYHHAAIKLADSFNGFYISHISHLQNIKVDALAALAPTLALPADARYCLTVATRYLFSLKHGIEVSEVHTTLANFEPRDWRFLIIHYPLYGILLDDPREAVSVRRRSTRFYYDVVVKTIYCRSYNGILLHCLFNSEAQKVIKEAHDGIVELINQVRSSRIDSSTWLLSAGCDH